VEFYSRYIIFTKSALKTAPISMPVIMYLALTFSIMCRSLFNAYVCNRAVNANPYNAILGMFEDLESLQLCWPSPIIQSKNVDG